MCARLLQSISGLMVHCMDDGRSGGLGLVLGGMRLPRGQGR